MRLSKHASFTRQQADLAGFAKSLAHPARIAIVTLLMEKPELCCSEIVDALPLAQATVSQHLRGLEQVGLIVAKPDGVRVCYRLDRSRLQGFCHAFQKTLRTAE